jgi:hypothetical protein
MMAQGEGGLEYLKLLGEEVKLPEALVGARMAVTRSTRVIQEVLYPVEVVQLREQVYVDLPEDPHQAEAPDGLGVVEFPETADQALTDPVEVVHRAFKSPAAEVLLHLRTLKEPVSTLKFLSSINTTCRQRVKQSIA